jgi:uncharacterized membrane protein
MLASGQIGAGIAGGSWVVAGLVLLLALRGAPWRQLARGGRVHLLLGAALALFLLWSLRAGVTPGLSLHYLGMTTVTLVLGWELAVVAGALALVALGLRLGLDPYALGANLVVTVMIPALWTYLLWRWVDAHLPRHFFIYVYVCAFAGAAVAALLSAVAVAGLLVVSGAYPWEKIGYDYLAYLPLLVLPEGIINGMVITGLIALRPQWVRTYQDPEVPPPGE